VKAEIDLHAVRRQDNKNFTQHIADDPAISGCCDDEAGYRLL
jgi:hypothetical protein